LPVAGDQVGMDVFGGDIHGSQLSAEM
jgi:hypothetical protein